MTKKLSWQMFAFSVVLIIAVWIRASTMVATVNLTGDAGSRYLPIAQNLVMGNGFSSSAQAPYAANTDTMPGYPAFLALILSLTNGNLRVVVLCQLVMELLLLWGVAHLAGLPGLPKTGKTIAVVLGLLCPFIAFFSGWLLAEVTTTLAVAAMCYTFVKASIASGSETTKWWLLAGLVTGMAVTFRPDTLSAGALMAIGAGWNFWKNNAVYRPIRKLSLNFGICGLAVLVMLLPWTMRNHNVVGKWKPFGTADDVMLNTYGRWLDTWLDDPALIHDYWWGVYYGLKDPNGTKSFPATKVTEPQERQRAEEALRIAKAQGNFDGAPSLMFKELADEARSRDPWRVRVVVPLRRVAFTWLRLPTYIQDTKLKIIGYGYWLLLLGCTALGCWRGLRSSDKTTQSVAVILLMLVLSRCVAPYLFANGAEPRYVLGALPACFILGAWGIQFLLEKVMQTRKNIQKSKGVVYV